MLCSKLILQNKTMNVVDISRVQFKPECKSLFSALLTGTDADSKIWINEKPAKPAGLMQIAGIQNFFHCLPKKPDSGLLGAKVFAVLIYYYSLRACYGKQ